MTSSGLRPRTGNLFDHPLAVPDWEVVQASPVRVLGRAIWAPRPDDGPDPRIVHARAVQGVSGPLRIRRLGVRRGVGYHKCASAHEFDAPRAVRLLAHQDGALTEVGTWRIDRVPDPDETVWFDVPLESETVMAVIDEAHIDREWPSWNLARTGLVLDGEALVPWQRPSFALLDADTSGFRAAAAGVTATLGHEQVRFRSRFLDVGFRLRSATLAYLGLDVDGTSDTGRNLLQRSRSMDIVRTGLYPAGVYPVLRDPQAHHLAQGPRLTLLDGSELAGFLGYAVEGSSTVLADGIRYELSLPGAGVRYRLTWTVEEAALRLDVERWVERPLVAWHSAAWHIATDTTVAATTVLGAPLPSGETGHVAVPATWHVPGHGSFVVSGTGDVALRSDSVRPLDTNTLEVKLAEERRADGTVVLAAGHTTGSVRFEARTPRLARVRAETPAVVTRALDRHLATALTFRADTGTFSNNGASMHCAGSLQGLGDVVAALTPSSLADRVDPIPSAVDGIDPVAMLEASIARWLTGAPGYGSGHTSRGDFRIEDEYLMLGADALYGLGRLLSLTSHAWFGAQEAGIVEAIELMRARDLDGDGLVESRLRQGISGEHQWSTTWADVVSFGWKDGWTNAILHGALRALAMGLRRLDRGALAADLDGWADRLRASYQATFLVAGTDWPIGWRSPDGVAHDHCHTLLIGDAVAHGVLEPDQATRAMQAVWRELSVVGYTDLANGIPINLHPIPEEELGGVVFGLPIGGYLQGGAVHHRTGGFVRALRLVGMDAEADLVIEALSSTVADDSAFGGVGSGRDWRLWDGTPSGYEGLLAEGFGFLAAALDRWGERA
ncbi:MAG: hypothetical protein KF809_18250 [Chloroflexi bacterium]|nr:hypothetical protein [Chloroflexota bacterium]